METGETPAENPTAFPHPAVRLQASGQRLDALAPNDEELWGDALLVQGQNTRLGKGSLCQLIGLREKIPENPIFHGKFHGFL